MPYSPTGRIRARLTLSAKLPRLTIAWSARPAVRFDRKIRIGRSGVRFCLQNIDPRGGKEKEITFSGQGNNRSSPDVFSAALWSEPHFVGLEAQEPVWTARPDPDRLRLFRERMRRNWKLAAMVLLVCLGCSLALGFLLPSYWRVEETLMPVPRSSAGSSNLGALAGLAGGLGGLGML